MAGDELECPNCGAKVDVADHRCGACGAMLDAGELVAIPDPEEATREGEVEPDEAELAPPAEPQADLRPEPERGWFDRWGRVALYLSYVAVSVAGSWALHRWLVNRSGEEDPQQAMALNTCCMRGSGAWAANGNER